MLKTHYRGKLPHIHPIGATFFITFRLAGSLPKVFEQNLKDWNKLAVNKIVQEKADNWKEQLYIQSKKYFQRFDNALDLKMTNVQHLANPKIATIVKEQIHRFDGEFYNLLAYSIMSNHVHLVFDTQIQLFGLKGNEEITADNYKQIDKIMKRIKGAAGRYCNLALGLKGQFFEHESYDHFVRNQKELLNILNYTVLNPVKAGLVKKWEDFPFSFWKGWQP